METLNRRAKIYDYLCTRSKESPATVTDIYKHFKSHHQASEDRKTFERDITYLSSTTHVIEVPINNRTKGFYAILEKKQPLLNFKIGRRDLFTLVTAITTFKQTTPKFFSDSCDRILIEMGKTFSEEQLNRFNLIRSITTTTQGIDGQSEAINNDDFDTLMQAIINRKCFTCQISYPLDPSKDEKKEYMPLSFYFSNNTPYLYVFDLKKKKNRLLRATRLTSVALLDKEADPKKVQAASIEVGPHFSGYGGEREINYKITSDKAFATFFLERPFVKPYQLIVKKNETYQISFTLNDNEQLIRMLAGWSNHLIDIEPKEIKTKVKDVLKDGQKYLN